MQAHLGSRFESNANKMGVNVSAQQQDLKDQHTGCPDGSRTPEPRQDVFAYDQLHLKQKIGT
jgi:hypothetical protein